MAFKFEEKFNKSKSLKKFLEGMSKIKVEVGFFDGKKNKKNEMTLATVAKINEYGSMDGFIKPRPFIRQTFSKHSNFSSQIKDSIVDSLKDRRKFVSYFNRLGIYASKEIQREFTEGQFVKNALRTIRRKKSSRPLMNKGDLRRGVSWRLKK